MLTERLSAGPGVVDAQVLARAADRCRDAGIALPTFAQLADPSLVPEPGPRARSRPSGRTSPTRSTSSASTGTTTAPAPASRPCPSTSSCRAS